MVVPWCGKAADTRGGAIQSRAAEARCLGTTRFRLLGLEICRDLGIPDPRIEDSMASVGASWRQIEEVLWENAHSVFQALRKPASRDQIQRLERKLEAKLPRDFVKSLLIHDGLRQSYLGLNRLFNYWALLPVSAIFQVWKMMTDLQAECNFGGDQFITTPQIKNDAHWRWGWIPFMDADGDKLVIDLDPGPKGKVGQIIEWSNSGSFPMTVLADTFADWLSDVADAFHKRRFQLTEYGRISLNTTNL